VTLIGRVLKCASVFASVGVCVCVCMCVCLRVCEVKTILHMYYAIWK
jgi:hypothetical protein